MHLFRILKPLLWVGILVSLGIMLIVFCSSSDDFSLTIVDGHFEAGDYRITWPQTDNNDELVASGTYSVRMSTTDFHDSREFRISSSFSSVSATIDSLFCVRGGGTLPTSFQLAINSTGYAPGDTVLICCTLPTAADLKVTVVRE